MNKMAAVRSYFLFVIPIIVITLVYIVSGYSQSALSIGHACQDGCHVCFKNEYDDLIKLPVKKTGVCDGRRTLHNGDLVCLYGYNVRTTMYLVNENVTTTDNCNTCICTEHGARCTKRTCNNAGFAKPSTKPLYGECNDNGRWYTFGALWEADDRCNTCTCVGVGNYQGPFICTQGNCKWTGPIG